MKTTVFIASFALLVLTNISLKAQTHDHNIKKDTLKTEMNHDKMVMKSSYTCPMHPEVKSEKPGDCSKCGMALVEKKIVQEPIFTCPMHPEIKSDKMGQCAKCGMDLVEKKTEPKSNMHKNHKHKN
jgi:hypothetical protein